jgi:hypothetical protein
VESGIGRAALAMRSGITAPQQRLYFLPLPQGQGSLRPAFIVSETYPDGMPRTSRHRLASVSTEYILSTAPRSGNTFCLKE